MCSYSTFVSDLSAQISPGFSEDCEVAVGHEAFKSAMKLSELSCRNLLFSHILLVRIIQKLNF